MSIDQLQPHYGFAKTPLGTSQTNTNKRLCFVVVCQTFRHWSMRQVSRPGHLRRTPLSWYRTGRTCR